MIHVGREISSCRGWRRVLVIGKRRWRVIPIGRWHPPAFFPPVTKAMLEPWPDTTAMEDPPTRTS